MLSVGLQNQCIHLHWNSSKLILLVIFMLSISSQQQTKGLFKVFLLFSQRTLTSSNKKFLCLTESLLFLFPATGKILSLLSYFALLMSSTQDTYINVIRKEGEKKKKKKDNKPQLILQCCGHIWCLNSLF